MKRFAFLLVLCGLVCVPRSFAQDHFAVGGYVDYFHLSQTNTNFAGVGARAGFALTSHVMLEGEMKEGPGIGGFPDYCRPAKHAQNPVILARLPACNAFAICSLTTTVLAAPAAAEAVCYIAKLAPPAPTCE